MKQTAVAKYAGLVLLIVSGVVYGVGDPLLRLISYQGPILSGALLGWFAMHDYTPKEKYVETEDGELIPIASVVLRGRAWLFISIAILMMLPWFTPFVYTMALQLQWLFIGAFLSEFAGGFIIGYSITSLRFMEKFTLYSLGFAADVFFIIILYIDSGIFHVSQQVLLNDVFILAYLIKLLEGVAFGVYIVRRVNVV
ncbi:MAG: hypothetical protein RXS23_09980 [Metallosphaera yellowstonensis]